MKKYLKTIFLCLPFLLVSCDNGGAHQHKIKEGAWSFDESGHYYTCSCNEDIRFNFQKHSFVENKEGISYCQACGYIQNKEKDEAWGIVHTALENSFAYQGSLTAKGLINFEESGVKGRSNTTVSSEPSSGKFVMTSSTEMFDDTTNEWVEAGSHFQKVEKVEEKFIYYESDPSDPETINAEYADKYYAEATLSNPFNVDIFGNFDNNKENNSLFNILSRTPSYSYFINKLPNILFLNSKGAFTPKFEFLVSDNKYVVNLGITNIETGNTNLYSATEMNYSFTFDKNILKSFSLSSWEKTVNLKEEMEESKHSLTYDFEYSFINDLYEKTVIETKPTPTISKKGAIKVIFDGGYVWPNHVRDVNTPINAYFSTSNLEIYYDAEMKNKISDEEVFTSLTKTYYAKPILSSTRATVLCVKETNFLVHSSFEPVLNSYVQKVVLDYATYTTDHSYTIPEYPTDQEKEDNNAKVTLNDYTDLETNQATLKLDSFNLIKIKIDKPAQPFDYA